LAQSGVDSGATPSGHCVPPKRVENSVFTEVVEVLIARMGGWLSVVGGENGVDFIEKMHLWAIWANRRRTARRQQGPGSGDERGRRRTTRASLIRILARTFRGYAFHSMEGKATFFPRIPQGAVAPMGHRDTANRGENGTQSRRKTRFCARSASFGSEGASVAAARSTKRGD